MKSSLLLQGLAAQSKAKAIGQNKISSANQRPAFQIIFFFFLVRFDLLISVRTVVEDSVREQRMNPFISPFPLEKRLNVSENARHGMGEASRPRM